MRNIFLLFALLSIFTISPSILADQYFLYDIEENKILYMNNYDTYFFRELSVEKKPDLMMLSTNSQEFLAVYLPRQKNKTFESPGQLIVFNTETGRTDDLVVLGYPPYSWTTTQNHNELFITYRNNKSGEDFELLHYNQITKTRNRIGIKAVHITDLTLSPDEKRLYLLTKGDMFNPSALSVIHQEPFMVSEQLITGANPQKVFNLSNERIAVLDVDPNSRFKGSIQLVDVALNEIISHQELKPYKTYAKWHEEHGVLVVEYEQDAILGSNLTNESHFFRVTADQITHHQMNPCIDFMYLPKQERLYSLTTRYLEMIDYRNNTYERYDIGRNYQGGEYCQLLFNPEDTVQMIYSAKNGKVRFFDIEENRILAEVKSGRPGKRSTFLKLFGEKRAKTTIARDPNGFRYFILNRISNDITVLNQKLDVLTYLTLEDQLLEVYQTNKPNADIIVTTKKGIYRIDQKNLRLIPIHNFQKPVEQTSIIVEEQRLIILSNYEIIVVDPDSMEVKNAFKLHFEGENMKAKEGEQRYYFIRTL